VAAIAENIAPTNGILFITCTLTGTTLGTCTSSKITDSSQSIKCYGLKVRI
jgi:hypothetical protein